LYINREYLRDNLPHQQELIAGGFGQTGCRLYVVAANQAVLGFTNTTANFKQQQQLPRHISIPDIPNMQGQVARCYAETCFQKFVSSNLECCSVLSPAMCIPFADKILPIRLAMVARVGISHLQCAFFRTP